MPWCTGILQFIGENFLFLYYGCTLLRFACISWTVYQQDIIVTDFVDEHGQLVVQVLWKFELKKLNN